MVRSATAEDQLKNYNSYTANCKTLNLETIHMHKQKWNITDEKPQSIAKEILISIVLGKKKTAEQQD